MNNELATRHTAAPTPTTVPMPLPARNHGRWLERGTAILDPAGRVLALNDRLAAWLGSTTQATDGADFLPLLARIEPALAETTLDLLSHNSPLVERSLNTRDADGCRRFAIEIASHGGTRVISLQSLLPPATEEDEESWDRQITDRAARRAMYLRLQRSEDRLRNLVERWPGVVFSQGADFCVGFASPKIESLTGVSPDDFRQHPGKFWEIVHEADIEALQKQFSKLNPAERFHTGTYRVRHHRTGRVAYVLEHREACFSRSGLLLGFEVVWLDVTRQTIAENRLSSASWKETLAVLTMGLAHDFSNIMAGIHSLSETFQSQVGADPAFQEGLALIRRNSMQASQLVHRILNLHHGKLGSRNYHDLNDLLTETLELMRKAIPKRIAISQQLAPVRLPLYVDAVEFRQVLVNLALNAAEAMPEGGRLVFETSRHTAPPQPTHAQGILTRVPAACVRVRDTGCGIPTRRLTTVFDPFFTTKAMNKGSGLGLYNARLFVEKHHGTIAVESVENQGTTFSLWLPEADFTEAERTEPNTPPARHSILLAGDPGRLLESTGAYLRQHGFYVLTAASEQAALDALSEPDYHLSATLVLASCDGLPAGDILARAHGLNPPLKTALMVVGCSQDDVDSAILNRADLIIPPDTPNPDILARLRALFA